MPFVVVCLISGALLGGCAVAGVDGFIIVHALWLKAALLFFATGLWITAARYLARVNSNDERRDHRKVKDEQVLKMRRFGLVLLAMALLLILVATPGVLGNALEISFLGRVVFGGLGLIWGIAGLIFRMDVRNVRLKPKLTAENSQAGVAEILRVRDSGTQLGTSIEVQLGLRIKAHDREPFEREFTGLCPRIALGRLLIGGQLVVKIFNEDDRHIQIDWMHSPS